MRRQSHHGLCAPARPPRGCLSHAHSTGCQAERGTRAGSWQQRLGGWWRWQRTPRTRHTSSASSATSVGAERSCQGPFLGDRGLNSVGRFDSAIAGSNLPATPWCWRHSLIDERPSLDAQARALPCRRSFIQMTSDTLVVEVRVVSACRWPRERKAVPDRNAAGLASLPYLRARFLKTSGRGE